MDLKKWECGVPGKDKTLWEGGLFKLEVHFPEGTSEHIHSQLRIPSSRTASASAAPHKAMY